MDSIVQKAHFFRRAGFGATLDELNSANSPEMLLSKWLNETPVLNVPAPQPIVKKGKQEQSREMWHWLLKQMISTNNPLHERIVNFWRDRFVVSLRKIGKAQLLLDYESRLRTYALGDFQELLMQVTTSPAMLTYLDNAQNRAGKINENYSREVMELFTLGQGQYTEKDIQEGARALTGWLVKLRPELGTADVNFVSRRHDDGIKNYLGRSGKLSTQDVVEILANHPSTARKLAADLWSALAYRDPEPAIIDRLALVYKQNNRSIKAVVAAVFNSPEFYSDKAYRSHLKTPLYFVLSSLRQLQIEANSDRVIGGLRAMGQVPYNAPSVKGWQGDQGWLTAPSLLTRLNVAQQFTREYGDDGGFDFNPDRYSAKDLVTVLLDGNSDRQLEEQFTGLSKREVAALILSSPIYQLA
ncbi:MAG: DUF1800 domain-containing protein [Pseudanabaena sp.]|jgi:uncharacterized protein (DUF1800 family)